MVFPISWSPCRRPTHRSFVVKNPLVQELITYVKRTAFWIFVIFGNVEKTSWKTYESGRIVEKNSTKIEKKKWLIFQLKWFIWKCLFREDWCFFLAQRCRSQNPKNPKPWPSSPKDGMWAVMAWLQILAKKTEAAGKLVSVEDKKTKKRRKRNRLFGSSSMFAVTDCN